MPTPILCAVLSLLPTTLLCLPIPPYFRRLSQRQASSQLHSTVSNTTTTQPHQPSLSTSTHKPLPHHPPHLRTHSSTHPSTHSVLSTCHCTAGACSTWFHTRSVCPPSTSSTTYRHPASSRTLPNLPDHERMKAECRTRKHHVRLPNNTHPSSHTHIPHGQSGSCRVVEDGHLTSFVCLYVVSSLCGGV